MKKLNIGIDLGTSNTLVYLKDKGIVSREPTVIAMKSDNKNDFIFGKKANMIAEKSFPNINIIYPIQAGIVTNNEATLKMLQTLIKKYVKSNFIRPEIAVCHRSNMTKVEYSTLVNVLKKLGASKTFLIEEPLAAAIGNNIDISLSIGKLIIDIGGGTCDISLISLNGSVISKSIKIAGNNFDNAIKQYISSKHNIQITKKYAENIKCNFVNLSSPNKNKTITITGKCKTSLTPTKVVINQKEISKILIPLINEIIFHIKEVIINSTPELSSDILTSGILLTGGSSLLNGLYSILKRSINIPISLSQNPLDCVAKGTGNCFHLKNDVQQGFDIVCY